MKDSYKKALMLAGISVVAHANLSASSTQESQQNDRSKEFRSDKLLNLEEVDTLMEEAEEDVGINYGVWDSSCTNNGSC